jgi:protein-L-isoaspartate(D-aspartate) O-methyltransferase
VSRDAVFALACAAGFGSGALLLAAWPVAGAGGPSERLPRGADADPEAPRRHAMVEEQLAQRGIRDARVLDAMRAVPRHRFVPEALRASAYDDRPLPIGRGQTISQPFVVAYMAEVLALEPTDRVLEVGSGSGYAAAVLARLVSEVHGIELEPELHERSVRTLEELGYRNVHLRQGDGFLGWPEVAPFDAILMSCAAARVPQPLWDQLAIGGRLLYPQEGTFGQRLVLVTKTPEGRVVQELHPVRFVPMRRAR